MVLGPIFGPLLISFAVKMGIRLVATAAKGLLEATPPSGGSTREAKESFPALLKAEKAHQSARIEPPASPSLTAPVPSPDLIGLLASEEQVRALALGIRVGKGAPPPAADPHAKRHIGAYRRLHPFAG